MSPWILAPVLEMILVKKKLLVILFLSCVLVACASSTKTVNFANSITYPLPENFEQIQKNGDFLIVAGGDGKRLVISENFLDPVLNQMSPKISSLDFFNYIYGQDVMGEDAPSQVLEFKNGFLDGPFMNKYKKTKAASTLFIWELPKGKLKAIELKHDSNYFLNIYAENIEKEFFLQH